MRLNNNIIIIITILITLTFILLLTLLFIIPNFNQVTPKLNPLESIDLNNNKILNFNDDCISNKKVKYANDIIKCDQFSAFYIYGNIYNTEGKPLFNANISIRKSSLITRDAPDVYNFNKGENIFQQTSAKDGSFKFEINPKTRYYVLANKNGYTPRVIDAYPDDHLTIVLKQSIESIKGLIINKYSKCPINKAKIKIIPYRNNETYIVSYSSDNGEFIFNNIPPEIRYLYIEHPDYEPIKLTYVITSHIFSKPFELIPRETINIKLKCIDNDSEMILSEINVNNKISFSDNAGIHTVSIFKDSSIFNQHDNDIKISANGYCPSIFVINYFNLSEINIVKLYRSTKCSGRIVDMFRTPLSEVEITPILTTNINNLHSLYRHQLMTGVVYSKIFDTEITDNNGLFILNDIPINCNLSLFFKKEGYALQSLDNILVNQQPISYIGDCIYKTHGVLKGLVTNERGDPISGAWVMVKHPDKSIVRSITDPNGYYNINIDSFSRFHISKKGYYFYTKDYDPPVDCSHDYINNIVLQESITIMGIVVDSNNVPVPGAKIAMLETPKGANDELYSDNNGKFKIYGVIKNESYHLKAYCQLDPVLETYNEDSVYYGGQKDVVLEISPCGSVFGEITDITGKLLLGDNVKIWLRENIYSDPKTGWSYNSFKYGYYSYYLEEGSYEIYAKSGEWKSDIEMFDIISSVHNELSLQLDLKQ